MIRSLKSIIFLNKNICYICLSEEDKEREYFCKSCYENLELEHGRAENKLEYIDEKYFSAIYNRFLRETIREFKFHGKNYLAKPLGELLLDTIRENNISDIDLIVPVPMSRRKKAKRGYNQSELLAKYVSGKTGIPMDSKNLVKIKNTKAQSGLDSLERKKNLIGVFKTKREEIFRDKKILLIDDIITTGSTLEECGKVLKNSHVKEITALTLGSTRILGG